MEKKRLTLTGNKMPENVYKKLEELGNDRKLTPYVVSLVEKEEQMDNLIRHLSDLTSKLGDVESAVNDLNRKIEFTSISPNEPIVKTSPPEVVQEGKLAISEQIKGGIDEPIEEIDF